ncbi:TRAP transporter large permease [Afifella sp. IM 167]|uniref:TRAP transporter large permease n=1 Tax=Afifella sp. IM 167 TaxID=2033586 RepID=UPI001CCB8097|nr:TRAP transporter large permease [Afifella sp. IM 167]MBZ8135166.1 C4-dicarboxylate ABC transporter permease [Afifella sp. IM 167]
MLIGVTLIVSLLIGVPIFAALGVAAMTDFLLSPIPLATLAHSLFSGVDKFPLIAIPCFVLAGSIMTRAGITEDIVRVMRIAVGRAPGGLAVVTILSCMFFAAISGSGPGTVAAIGGLLIPAMAAQGYDRGFAAAVASAGGTLGILIPPSNPMIIYGVLAGVSIGDLFIAGLLPGLLIGLALMATAVGISALRGYRGQEEGFDARSLWRAIFTGIPSLLAPAVVLGGIYLGIFTPVEAAVVAVLYALLVGILVKRSIGLRQIWASLSETSAICGGLILIMGTAIFFGQFMALNQVPQSLAAALLAITDNPVTMLLLISAMLLVLGTFMETLSTIIILTPILLPLVKKLGIDPIHFGIILVVTSEVGFLTPPLGVNLFVASGLSGVKLETLARRVIPFLVVLVAALLVILLVPWLSLALIR